MKNKFFLFVLFTFSLSYYVFSFPLEEKSKPDSFYIFFTIGYPFVNQINNELNNSINHDVNYFKHAYYDLSIYFTLNNNLLLGTGLGGVTPYTANSLNYFSILNLSALYFFKRASDGFYLKFEVCPITVFTLQNGNNDPIDKGGAILKAGFGHSLPTKSFLGGMSIGIDTLFFSSIYEKTTHWKMLSTYGYFNIWY